MVTCPGAQEKEEPEEELTEVAPPALPITAADSNVKMIEEVLETLKVLRKSSEIMVSGY